MPPKQASRSRAGKGPRARKGKGNRADNSVIPKQPKTGSPTSFEETWTPVFPARTTRHLRYSTFVTLTVSSVGTVAGHVFSANGLYDPDNTGAGHQPMGFDQMMSFYNHYHCRSSRINVLFRNTSGVPVDVALALTAGTTITTNADTVLEFGLLNKETLETKNVSGSVKQLTESVSVKHYEGVDDVMDVTELSGTISTNPSEQVHYQILCWDPQNVGGSVLAEVIIEYVATFSEPRILTPSQVALLKRALLIDDSKVSSRTR